MMTKEAGQEPCVMRASIGEHDDHAAPRSLLAKQSPEEGLEGSGVADGAHRVYSTTVALCIGPEPCRLTAS
jgi:hypothetical protein